MTTSYHPTPNYGSRRSYLVAQAFGVTGQKPTDEAKAIARALFEAANTLEQEDRPQHSNIADMREMLIDVEEFVKHLSTEEREVVQEFVAEWRADLVDPTELQSAEN